MSQSAMVLPGDPRIALHPTPDTPQPRVFLDGISGDSPLGEIVLAALSGIATPAFHVGAPPEPRQWRRAASGTALQWWSKAVSVPNYAGAADISVNLHRQEAGRAGRTWCIVDAAGAPLLSRFQALAACHAEPYVATVNLIESENGGVTWELIAEAHVSSARSYPELLDVLGRTSARLLQMGLRRGSSSRSLWRPGPRVRQRSFALGRAQITSGLAWLRARISGEVYGIAILDEPTAEFTKSRVFTGQRWLQIPASEGFIADPFFWPGRPGTMLCETYLHRTGLGELTILSVDAEAIVQSEPMPIGLGSHLSYPSTWSENGRVFCLPEMAASRRQVLYELRPGMPPEPLCVINEGGSMADPTLMKVGGLYWIAYTDTDIGTYDNLCMLYADRLEGPWQPHSNNPVKIDARSCRPGGTAFWVDGQLFRPAQDCSREYGGALIVNRVDACTPDEYREVPVARLLPDPGGLYPDGLHMLSFGNGCAVIDGKRISYHPAILFHKMYRRVKSRLMPSRSDTP